MDAPNPTPQTDYRLEFVGSWPGVLDNLANAQSTWKLTDAEDTVWVLQTFLDPISGKYDIARPVSRTTRDGLIWTFTYGTANQLTKIEDSYGKEISFTWLTGSWSGGAFPLAISEAVLPGGYRLVYSYSDVAGATAPISPDRLTRVELKTSAGVLLDGAEYLYEDAVVPTFVTGVLDRDGVRRWTVDYDAYGRAVESTAPGGAFSTQIAYGALGTTFNRTATSALGKQTIYNFAQSSYGYSGRWTGAAGQAGAHTPASTRSYAYGANKLTSSMTDEEGRVTTYVRNARGLPTQVIEAFGTPSARTTTIAWHATFNLPTQIVQPGRTTDFTYDTAGRLATRVETDTTTFTTPYTTNGRTRTWTYGWSTTGQLLTIDGPLAGTGDTITYAYDADGYLASVTNEVGQATTITSVDWRGAPLTVEDSNGVETVLTYDPRGRLLTATLDPGADQSVYALEYNAVGDVAKLTLPGGGWLEYSYDDASRLTGIENDRGQTQVFVNNGLGQPTSAQVKDAGATVTRSSTFAYDELGRLLQSIGAGSQTTAFAYDKLSNLTQITDARGKIYGSSFDPLNRLITTTNPDSQTNEQTFNGQDDLTAFEDGRGLVTSRKVDGFGRTIQETSPDRGTLTYWYDNRDNVTKIVDGDGVETVFTYDDADRRLSASFTGASGENVTYGYDSTSGGNKGVGRLTSVDDEPGSSAFTYDAQGRLTLDAKVIQGQSYAVGYAYDENGEVVSLTLPSGRTVSLARGGDGLISGITSKATPASAVETLASAVTWRPFGPLAGLTYGNGLSLTNGYDLNDWMSGLEVTDGTAVLDLTYGRNANGELTSVVDNAATGRAATYGYTDSGRLNLANGAWGNDTYAYDAAGNRSQMMRTISAVTTTWDSTIPAGANRISELENASSVVTRRLTYRTGGAITRDERVGGSTYDYVYNARGRMISASKDSVLAGEYGYDAFGRRVWREAHGTGAVHIHYIFDPDGHLLAEHDAATGDVLREYVWLEDTPLAMFDYSGGSPVTFFIHTGQIGEPLAVTDASKAKVWDAAIEPFGQAVMFATASEALDLRLPGQWLQAETGGLFQNWMRDYDPTLGRYAQADPLGIEAGENLYGYVSSSPLGRIDFAGLRPTGPLRPLTVPARVVRRGVPAVGAVFAAARIGAVVYGVASLDFSPGDTTLGPCPDGPRSKSQPYPHDECEKDLEDELKHCVARYSYSADALIGCRDRARKNYDLCLRGAPRLNWWNDTDQDGWTAPPPPRKRKWKF
ncbi:RHS repeat-associated core domain-containing protein [Caulobacter sp. NIBR1757]|uniref:RHS repeat-associated core domain-containing protein n=1 Tax=Caulobacter sp. NIBR1757 TaxID=3016000 RepID=UPI0032AF071F